MPATGLEVFDKTIQTTNIWLDEIMDEIGPDRHVAWHVLGAVLRTLRDRLTVEEAAHLSAQLPLLVRGLYYDQWRPSHVPAKWRTQEEFMKHVADGLQDIRPVNQQAAVQAVFDVLARHISIGEFDEVAGALPAKMRPFFEQAAAAPAKPHRAERPH
jgi:uncharacterized protein (DUF2267 family)